MPWLRVGIMTLTGVFFAACSEPLHLEFGISWKDDQRLILESDSVSITVMEGRFTDPWALPSGEPEYLRIPTLKNETFRQSCSDEGQQDMTAILYRDLNLDGCFQDGHDELLAFSVAKRRSEDRFWFHLVGYY